MAGRIGWQSLFLLGLLGLGCLRGRKIPCARLYPEGHEAYTGAMCGSVIG